MVPESSSFHQKMKRTDFVREYSKDIDHFGEFISVVNKIPKCIKDLTKQVQFWDFKKFIEENATNNRTRGNKYVDVGYTSGQCHAKNAANMA